ncbi:MAG: NAD(P)-dependent oxidoreductase [Planctomycetota bacterium]|jgi:3-hydroxyisobutyrate dehydrogenase-like beta-hydroxyacid dehydrogenase
MAGAGSPTIGFLGLGQMGGPMARSLVAAGYEVVAYDIVAEKTDACVAAGATAGEGGPDVVGRSEVVMTSLRSSAVFVAVAEADLLPNAREGQVFVDLGTTEVPETRRLAAEFAAKGAALLDCPLSGSTERGTLRVFAAGDRETVQRCLPILEALGHPSHVTYCGPSGCGQVVKAVNQLAMGLGAAAYVEAVAFGARDGVDPAVIRDAVGGKEGWRANFGGIAGMAAEGRADEVLIKFPELPYYLREARERGFDVPLTQALFEYCDVGEKAWVDNMNRPRPSFWHELMTRGGARP